MANFAQIDENNMVINVIVVDDLDAPDESTGIDFLRQLNLTGNWLLSSLSRKNYAGIGYTYRQDIDAFVPPKPFASWLLNAQAQWEAPVAMPTDGKMYSWDEDTVSWKDIVG